MVYQFLNIFVHFYIYLIRLYTCEHPIGVPLFRGEVSSPHVKYITHWIE